MEIKSVIELKKPEIEEILREYFAGKGINIEKIDIIIETGYMGLDETPYSRFQSIAVTFKGKI